MKIKLYVIIIILLGTRFSYSYDQDTHKWLTIQAWELVRYQYPEVIGSEMDIAMKRGHDYTWEGYNWGPFSQQCIVNGSFVEDDHDAAFHEENRLIHCGPFSSSGIFTSANHFWNPDLGFGYQHSFWTCCGTYGRFNNARDKLIAYGDGLSTNWTQNYKFNIPWGPYSVVLNGETVQALIGISYFGLHNGIKGQLYVPRIYVWRRIGAFYMYFPYDLPTPQPLSNYVTSPSERDEIRKYITWEIAGRMCHLIEDMGVPAHAHDDPHPTGASVCSDPDYYEHHYIPSYRTSKTYMDAYNQGGVINYSSYWWPTQVAAYSSYIVNQVSDRFGSSDEWGDANYLTAYASDLQPIYNSIGNITPEPGHGNEVQDVLFAHNYVHSIRRLAGFLWHLFNFSSVQPGLPYDLTLESRILNHGINYRALNNISLNNVTTATGGNNFTAGNLISITNSHIVPSNGSNFKIQYLGDNPDDSVRNLFVDGIDPIEIDSNYSEREMFYTLRQFRAYELAYLSDGKKTVPPNEITPESDLGLAISDIVQNNSFEDVTNIVYMLDTIPVGSSDSSAVHKTVVHIEDSPNIPKEFSLSQNYPNPFNPKTNIKYGLKHDVQVKITVYDIMGRVVKTLVDEYQTAGYKSVIWDGTNGSNREISSGVYFYKIEAGSFVSTKKMLLLK